MTVFKSIIKLTSLGILICGIYACGSSGDCENEMKGVYAYQVTSKNGSGLQVSGGLTKVSSSIEKLDDLGNDVILMKAFASVTDGGTCVSGFNFVYDMKSSQVVDIPEVIYGCDTTIVWSKGLLDVALEIEMLDFDLRNVSGELSGSIVESGVELYEIIFNFDQIPICFE